MFGIQPIHILIIAIVALIIFGPKHLPQIGSSIAKAIRDLRGGMKDMSENFHEEITKSPSPLAAAQPFATPPQSQAATAVEQQTAAVEAGPYCTQCGAANPPASQFCHKCGRQLVDRVA